MDRRTLELVNAALAASLAACAKAHVPGDAPEDHEDNTFGLPEGSPLRRKLRAFFLAQLKQVVGFVGKAGAEIPKHFPPLADYTDPMASAMTPVLSAYWDKSGKALRGRLQLDPDEWRVTDPNVHRAIASQAIRFCKATNATTDLSVHAAAEAVRRRLQFGLIGRGEAIPELVSGIRAIFTRATKERAVMIARTEAARAVHAASLMSAESSGVVAAKKWLLSANSCPTCHALAAAAESLPLAGEFGQVGNNPDYASVKYPPAHPHCRCSMTYVLADAGKPEAPAFVPPAKPAPEPKPEPKPKPAPKPTAPPAPPAWKPSPASDFAEHRDDRARAEWGRRNSAAWAKTVTPRERDEFRDYTGQRYDFMNLLLRYPKEARRRLSKATVESLEKSNALLAAALERGRTAEGGVAYRGIKDFRKLGVAARSDIKPGDSISDAGFASLSLDRDVAAKFAARGGPTGIVLEVRMPSGSTGGYLNAEDASGSMLTINWSEDEFLCPPGSQYRVVENLGHKIIVERVQ